MTVCCLDHAVARGIAMHTLHIDGLAQDCSNASALAMDLLQ